MSVAIPLRRASSEPIISSRHVSQRTHFAVTSPTHMQDMCFGSPVSGSPLRPNVEFIVGDTATARPKSAIDSPVCHIRPDARNFMAVASGDLVRFTNVLDYTRLCQEPVVQMKLHRAFVSIWLTTHLCHNAPTAHAVHECQCGWTTPTLVNLMEKCHITSATH
jgi:hypothetical protein